MKSPVRKRTAAGTSAASTASALHSTSTTSQKRAADIFKTSDQPARSPFDDSHTESSDEENRRDGNVRPASTLQNQRIPSNSSLLRSPGKVGLKNFVGDVNKENLVSSKPSPSKASATAASRQNSGDSQPRHPAPRNVLASSTNSRHQQPQSTQPSGSPVTRSMAGSTTATATASPTPRPQTRTQSPRSNKLQPSTVKTTPVKVVDDVFMLTSSALTHKESQQKASQNGVDEQEEEVEEGDDEEVADILLGYAKTPVATAKKAVTPMVSLQNGATGPFPFLVCLSLDVLLCV